MHPYKASKTYADLKQLLPAWEPATDYDTVRDVSTWLLEQPPVQTALARKLINALNSFTKVPVLDA